MGQKTNPNILRLGVTKNWKYKYLEKKSSELPLYDFKSFEIEKLVNKFFNDNNLFVNNCKISYSYDNIVQIFISYYAAIELESLIKNLKTNSEISPTKFAYKMFNYVKKLSKWQKKPIKVIKKRVRKLYYQKVKKNFKMSNKNDCFKNSSLGMIGFIKKLCESISLFLNSKVKIVVTLQQLNKKLKKKVNKQEVYLLKRQLAKFDKYDPKNRNKFLKDGLNILYLCSQQPNSANLLAEFIANKLKKLKQHTFFFRFIKSGLSTFRNNTSTKLKGVKIKIKGRINRARRAKYKFFKIGKELPIMSINSKIDYAEKTAYTRNGTLGIKVWTL